MMESNKTIITSPFSTPIDTHLILGNHKFMKTVAYFKTSRDRHEVREQRQTIVEFAQREGIALSQFIEMPAFSGEKRIAQLIGHLDPGDTLIVSELSRIGRSVGQIVRTVDALIKAKIRFIAVKEDICLDEKNSQAQVMVRMFELLARTDRQLARLCY